MQFVWIIKYSFCLSGWWFSGNVRGVNSMTMPRLAVLNRKRAPNHSKWSALIFFYSSLFVFFFSLFLFFLLSLGWVGHICRRKLIFISHVLANNVQESILLCAIKLKQAAKQKFKSKRKRRMAIIHLKENDCNSMSDIPLIPRFAWLRNALLDKLIFRCKAREKKREWTKKVLEAENCAVQNECDTNQKNFPLFEL